MTVPAAGHTVREELRALKFRMKIVLTLLLAVFAAMSLLAVLADLGVLSRAEPALAQARSGYLLRSWDGFIGVFCPPDADEPVAVTDIRVRDLPLSDRIALNGGVAAEDYGRVIRLLEDYGS